MIEQILIDAPSPIWKLRSIVPAQMFRAVKSIERGSTLPIELSDVPGRALGRSKP
jgi:hypothetical protein